TMFHGTFEMARASRICVAESDLAGIRNNTSAAAMETVPSVTNPGYGRNEAQPRISKSPMEMELREIHSNASETNTTSTQRSSNPMVPNWRCFSRKIPGEMSNEAWRG